MAIKQYMSDTDDFDPVLHWLKNGRSAAQNFGDFLSEILLQRILITPKFHADAYHLIGSVISDGWVRDDLYYVGNEEGTVAFWGCGLRDDRPLSAWTLQHSRFFGVRGPKTRRVLNLPAHTPLGDPGLLMPLIHQPKGPSRAGARESICVIHYQDPRSDAEIADETGVSRVFRASIPASIDAALGIIDAIASAEFVLCGALHAAVTACAYGSPFAYYDSGYIDTPFKWEDFSESIGVACVFVKTLDEGRAAYEAHVCKKIAAPPLLPILAVCPFAVRASTMVRAMIHDADQLGIPLQEVLAQLDFHEIDAEPSIQMAKSTWRRRGSQLRHSARTVVELQEQLEQRSQERVAQAERQMAAEGRADEAVRALESVTQQESELESRLNALQGEMLQLGTENSDLQSRLARQDGQLSSGRGELEIATESLRSALARTEALERDNQELRQVKMMAQKIAEPSRRTVTIL